MKIGSPEPVGPQIRIRHFREALGVTVADLVDRLAEQGVVVHPDTIRNIELGRRRASAPLMAAWCRALGLSPIDAWQPERQASAANVSSHTSRPAVASGK